jgi:stage II sporulation protein E
MENITVLKGGRKLTKQLVSLTPNITIYKAAAFIMCFIFARAGIFDVIKPFSSAFYVSMSFTGISKLLAIAAIIAGNAVFANFYETVRQTSAILLFEALSRFILKNGRMETNFSRSMLMAVLTFATGILKGLMLGLHLYDLVVSLISAALVFSLSFIITPASEASERGSKPEWKTTFAKASLLCAVIISLKGVMVFQCEIGSIIAGTAVIILARRKGSGAGACAGALFGMVIAFYDLPSSLNIPGMMALAGAAAGLPIKSKTAGMTLWTAVVIFFAAISVLDGSLILNYYEALASGILFYLIPKPALNWLSNEFAGRGGSSDSLETHAGSIVDEAADKLFVLSKALSRVSRSMEDTVSIDSGEEDTAVRCMIETVAEKVCNRCSLCERCWETHFLKTYKLVEKTISDIKTDESGQLAIPAWFKNTCSKSDKFFESLGAAYSLYKAENVWRTKLKESRLLVARQAAVISGSVLTEARMLVDEPARDIDLENRLLETAEASGIPVRNFRHNGRQASRPFLEAVFETKNKLNINDLDDMVREIVQSNLIRVGENRRDIMGLSVVRYMRQPKFKTATGVARASRESGEPSGDNVTFFISGEGCHVCAISDGTGSGKHAEQYSRTAIQLLENFMEDGIEIGLAIKLLNLYLNLKGENERLATMDICVIDLYNGNTEFFKYGAPASFIKGSQGVFTFNTETNESINNSTSHFRPAVLTAGDFAVMVSDGIVEAFLADGEMHGLEKFIEGIDTSNAQQLADIVLQEALERLKGNHDDMTVLVTKLW